MKIYSNVLDDDALHLATATVPGLGFEQFSHLRDPRIRSRGWDIRLCRAGSRRRFNTGRHGAGEDGAASHADHGWFLAALYERDPAMAVRGAAPYDSRDDFRRTTQGAFRLPRPEDGTRPAQIRLPFPFERTT
jgi:hypothetical protein